jgi:hypothetical protein
MWGDERFRRCSDDAKLLWVHLLTGPHTTALPGLSVAGKAQIAEALTWEAEAFEERFQEIADQGMARADWSARVVWLPNAARHNPPDNPNVVSGWLTLLAMVPECDLKREAIAALRAFVEPFGEPFAERFREPSHKPLPKQEQEQKPDQKPKTSESKGRPLSAPAAVTANTRSFAFMGKRFKVWKSLDADFVRALGNKPFDLSGFYVALDAKMEASGEPIENETRWLWEQFNIAAGFGRKSQSAPDYSGVINGTVKGIMA